MPKNDIALFKVVPIHNRKVDCVDDTVPREKLAVLRDVRRILVSTDYAVSMGEWIPLNVSMRVVPIKPRLQGFVKNTEE